MTHSSKCILNAQCRIADSPACIALCPSYVAVHGFSGSGGRVGNANLPQDYRNVTLKTSPAREAQAEAYELVEAYAATFPRQHEPDGPRVKSLYLFSESPGTGKTTTAAALLNEWLIVHYIGSVRRSVQPLERPAYFVDVNAWQSLYNGFNRANVPEETAKPLAAEYYAIEARAKAAPFVVLDDIGVRSATEAFRADLHGIVNHRVANALPTVYTSNVPMRELAFVFDARLADRIRDMTAEIMFTGTSKRGMR